MTLLRARIETMLLLSTCSWTCILAAPAHAWPVVVTAGFDHASRGSAATTRAALLAGTARIGSVEATLTGLRFEDSVVGTGSGLTAGLATPLAPGVALQLLGSRFLADAGYASWRGRLGPRLDLPGGASAWIAWAHDEDNAGLRSNGAVLESTAPLVAGFTARLDASAATLPAGRWSEGAAAGLAWSAVPHLQLVGEGGVARNAGGVFTQSAPPPLLGILPRGSDRSGTMPDTVTPTLQLGVRVTLP